jgi:hypothetical protein
MRKVYGGKKKGVLARKYEKSGLALTHSDVPESS